MVTMGAEANNSIEIRRQVLQPSDLVVITSAYILNRNTFSRRHKPNGRDENVINIILQ